jgi:hypothetical protein
MSHDAIAREMLRTRSGLFRQNLVVSVRVAVQVVSFIAMFHLCTPRVRSYDDKDGGSWPSARIAVCHV